MNKYLYLVFVILFWSTTPSIVKILSRTITPLEITFYIFLIALIALFFILLSKGKLKFLKKYSKKDLSMLAFLGLIGITISNQLYLLGFKFLPAAKVTALDYTYPVFIVLLSFPLLKAKFTFKKLIAILLGFIGIYLIITKGNILTPLFTNIKGDLIVLGAAISWAIFTIIGKKTKYEKYSSMFYYILFGLIFITIQMFYTSSFRSLSILEITGLLYLGITTKALAFVFWFIAIERIGAAKCSSIIYLVPFLAFTIINVVLGETIYWYYYVALALVIGGILLQHINIGEAMPED